MTEIEIDTRQAERMFDDLLGSISGVTRAVNDTAEQGARMVQVRVANYSGRSTGDLAESIVAEGSRIGTDVPYAGFVFSGRGRGPAQPPVVPEAAIARILERNLTEALFKTGGD